MHDLETNAILDDPIEDEVREAISCLKKNKAPGLDGLTPTAFKLFNNQLTSFTTTLLTVYWNKGFSLIPGV
jgi:hypothetical protein